LKQRSKKLLLNRAVLAKRPQDQIQTSFLVSFFKKKNRLLSSPWKVVEAGLRRHDEVGRAAGRRRFRARAVWLLGLGAQGGVRSAYATLRAGLDVG
jgi:hypothetical protein